MAFLSKHLGKWIPKTKAGKSTNTADAKEQSSNTPNAVIVTETNHPPTNGKHCKKRYECIKTEIKWWFEVGGILGGLCGLYLLWKQYGEMAKTTQAMTTQITVMQGQFQAMTNQASIMKGQFQAMTNQDGILEGQLEQMQESTELDERAWVSARRPTFSVQNDIIGITSYFENTGKTIAIHCHPHVWVTWSTNTIPKRDTDTDFESGYLLPPNAPSYEYSGTNDMDGIGVAKTFYVYGTVWYGDVFTKDHWSQFCYQVRCERTSQTNFGFSNPQELFIHSSCDDNQTDQTNQ
jgi:hypothetical protein